MAEFFDDTAARTLRQREPYHFQRDRQIGNKQPRAPQAGIQPNQIPPLTGWGMGTTVDYWNEVSSNFQRRRKSGGK